MGTRLSVGLQAIVEELLAATGAARTTLRLDRPPEVFPVVAEACAPGVSSIRGDGTVDLRKAPTFTAVAEELRTLIQEDTLRSDPPTPQAVVDAYGVRAQMLAPVARDGTALGTISVHASEPRAWTAADRAALASAADAVLRELDAEEGD
jgi:maleate isomerase